MVWMNYRSNNTEIIFEHFLFSRYVGTSVVENPRMLVGKDLVVSDAREANCFKKNRVKGSRPLTCISNDAFITLLHPRVLSTFPKRRLSIATPSTPKVSIFLLESVAFE